MTCNIQKKGVEFTFNDDAITLAASRKQIS